MCVFVCVCVCMFDVRVASPWQLNTFTGANTFSNIYNLLKSSINNLLHQLSNLFCLCCSGVTASCVVPVRLIIILPVTDRVFTLTFINDG